MAKKSTNTKEDGAFSRVEGVIVMALKNEISWQMLDLLLEELTPTLEKSKQVIKILLKELHALSSSFQKMKAQKDSLTIETSGESEKPKDEERSESKYQETEKICNNSEQTIQVKSPDDSITMGEVSLFNIKNDSEDEDAFHELEKLQSRSHNQDMETENKALFINDIKEQLEKIDDFESVRRDDNLENDIILAVTKITSTEKTDFIEEQTVESDAEETGAVFNETVLQPSQCENDQDKESENQKIEHKNVVLIKGFKCEKCWTEFKRKHDLKSHEKIHTGEKSFKCKFCNKAFNRSFNLQRHEKSHIGEKPFGCDICSKTFLTKNELKQHMLIHTGEKPFQCKICKKSYTSKSYLKSHERIHSGEKPYKCQTCDKSFTQLMSFIFHKRSHTREKPYACKTCSRSFSSMSHARSHERIHRNGKPYQCKNCNNFFADVSDFEEHAKKSKGNCVNEKVVPIDIIY